MVQDVVRLQQAARAPWCAVVSTGRAAAAPRRHARSRRHVDGGGSRAVLDGCRLEQDHRGVKQRYRVTGGLKTFGTAARFCRLFDEIRAFFRPQSYCNQRLTLTQRRCIHQERFAPSWAYARRRNLSPTNSPASSDVCGVRIDSTGRDRHPGVPADSGAAVWRYTATGASHRRGRSSSAGS
jgi:hypothetical protein